MSSYVELETRTIIKGTRDKYIIKIDKDDHQWISQLAVYVVRQHSTWGYVLYKDYSNGIIERNGKTLSRVIMGLKENETRFAIKYLNDDPLDLRKENLEIITRIESAFERDRVNRKGLPRGVYPGHGGKFISIVGHFGKQKYLGTFDTPEEAHRAYLEARESTKKILKGEVK